MSRNEQEEFWENKYEKEYQEKNSSFDVELGIEAWIKMLAKADGISSFLECGCNIGRNLNFLNQINPNFSSSIIELSKSAYSFVESEYDLAHSFNGTILESDFKTNSFDLVFTSQVLIHIHPDNLIRNMEKIFSYSKKYILINEYFNRTPTSIDYQGEKDKLFKRDFGKLFKENFNVNIVDYGFHWGYIYDLAGFDDTTWWLFEKE